MTSVERDFARIMAAHAARVRRVLRAHGVAERDLPDAQQDVFVVVHRKLPGFEGRSSLATWLHRIALHVASEYRRRPRHRHETLATDTLPEAIAPALPERLEARDALARVTLALARLNEEQRQALLLHELEGLSMHEVAAQQRVPLKTAFSRFYAARRALFAALSQRGIARSALLSWLCLLPARFVSRAYALGARLSVHTGALPLTALVVLCSVLPGPAARERTRQIAHASSTVHAEAPVGTIAIALRSQPEPSQAQTQAPSVAKRIVPARRSVVIRELARESVNASAAPEAAISDLVSDPVATELIVTRQSAVDLRPNIEPPFAARLASPALPSRIQLRGPRDAASAIESELGL